jgi:hypothetical protein
MQDPRQQQLLFTEWNHDDMESDDYEEAYFNYLLDHLDEEMQDRDDSFETSMHDDGKPLTCQ